MCSSSPPPAPDNVAAANATAQGNLDAARAATAANRVNQYTPYGNLEYSVNGQDPYGNATWSAKQTLSPEQQQIFDQTMKLNTGLMGTANSGLDYANQVLSHPGVDLSQLPQTGFNPGQSYQDAMMTRLQPQIDRENQQSDAQLANQGIGQGTQAYNNAKQVLNQSHNDLLNSATVQGFNAGQQANQNAFQQQSYNQMQPINVINALRTGSQVQSPNYASSAQQTTTSGADLMGAANQDYAAKMGNYNANTAQNNANTSAAVGVLGAAAMMF